MFEKSPSRKLLIAAALLLLLAFVALEAFVVSHVRAELGPHLGEDQIERAVGRIVARFRLGAALLSAAALAVIGFRALRTRRALERIRGLLESLPGSESAATPPASTPGEVGQVEAAANELATRIQDWKVSSREAHGLGQTIFAAMTEGVVAVDKDQRVLLANAAGRRLLNLPSDGVLDRKLWELVRTPEITRSVDQCLRTGERVDTQVLIETEAEPCVFDLQVTPLVEAQGGCFLALRDVTELRRLEEVRRQFVANVSHELKTPLTSMRGYVEAVLSDPDLPVDKQRDFLAKANRNTERLERIVTDLLSLARLESERVALSVDPIDVVGLTQEVLKEFRSAVEQSGVRLTLKADGGRVLVDGDPLALELAVSNLISNALRYSPDGATVRVTIGVGEGLVRIDVADEGPGIAPMEQERIFERFYRVDKNRSRRLGGTGLGLSIVKRAVTAHNGSISVESALGRGSTFRISLPLSQAAGGERFH